MKSIIFSSIPLFLREGSFYSSLNNEEEDGEIQIPAQCYAENDTVKDIQDFAQLVRATAFWGLYRIPQSLIAFCDLNEVYVWDTLLEREHAELPFARSLRSIFTLRWQGESFLVAAIQSGITEIVEYLATKQLSWVGWTIYSCCASSAINGRYLYAITPCEEARYTV